MYTHIFTGKESVKKREISSILRCIVKCGMYGKMCIEMKMLE